jgi:hypothetical protein
MGKIIRPTYPREFSVGLLILIFALVFLLSSQVFDVHWGELLEGTNAYYGMLLVAFAVVVMVVIIWEEFFFPVKLKSVNGGVVFRNHTNKLHIQLLIYCIIPAIFAFVYTQFKVDDTRFFIWAAISTLLPVAIKLISGLKNYNDFLKLTHDIIVYKNNKKEGVLALKDIQRLTLIRDERKVLHKIEVLTNGKSLIIDLDEMELDAFLNAIDEFIATHYKDFLA